MKIFNPPDLGGQKITNLGTPTAGTDAAHKTYADGKMALAGTETITGLKTFNLPVAAKSTQWGTATTIWNQGSDTYWKIATLPISSGGTMDHVLLDVVLDDNWSSNQKAVAQILLGNRNAFTWRYLLQGAVRSNVRVVAYTEADASVSVYMYMKAATFSTWTYNVSATIGATVYQNPVSTTATPTGTKVFDSGDVATYVPDLYYTYSPGTLQFQGQAVILNSDARLTNARTPSNDAQLVHLAGAETITGTKSFSAVPNSTVAPAGANDLANKGYIDNRSLTPDTTSHTVAFTAVAGKYHLCDATSGAYTVTLPTAAAAGTTIALVKTDTGVNAVSVAPGGTDTLNYFGSPQLQFANEAVEFVCDGAGKWDVLLALARGTYGPTPNGAMIRDAAGRVQIGDPSVGADAATKNYVDGARLVYVATNTTAFVATPNGFHYLNPAASLTVTLPAAQPAGTVVRLKRYDTNMGRTVTVQPTTGEQIDGTVNNSFQILKQQYEWIEFIAYGTNNWYWSQGTAGGAAANTADATIRRDAFGRAQVAAPAAAQDIANRSYVDGKFAAPFAGTDPADTRWHYVGMPNEPPLLNATRYDLPGNTFSWPRFRKDPEGCVWIEGLLAGITAGNALFTLPAGYRPANTLMFGVEGSGSGCQIQINVNGVVSFQNSQVAPSHLALDNISFMAEDFNPPTWTALTLSNGWSNLAGFNPAQVYVDSCGDAHFTGVITGGAAGTICAAMPAGSYATDNGHIHTAWSNAGTARIDHSTAGVMSLAGYGTGGSNASLSLDGLVVPNVGGYWGAKTDYANSWTYYGAPWATPALTVNKNGIAAMRGLVKSGVAGVTAIMTAAINPLYAPTHQKLFLSGANANKSCRTDISAAGIVTFTAYYDGGANGYVSLDTMRWNTQFAHLI